MQTAGFKQVLTTAQDFMQSQSVYTNGRTINTDINYIGLLGLGVQSGPEFVDFEQGALQDTGNQLDLALEGNGYFTIDTPNGQRYTRDGRFQRDAENTLVTIDGFQVLDDAGQPITVPDGDVSVGPDGAISVNGTAVATLGIGVFATPETELVRAEGNLFTGPTASTSQDAPRVAQGYLEMSNADASQMMTQLVEVARSYEAAQKLVQNQDELLGKSIASLGRLG
jgi:flagellar basal body rod protein FlgG